MTAPEQGPARPYAVFETASGLNVNPPEISGDVFVLALDWDAVGHRTDPEKARAAAQDIRDRIAAARGVVPDDVLDRHLTALGVHLAALARRGKPAGRDVKTLRRIAQMLRVKGRAGMRRDELVAAIKAARAAQPLGPYSGYEPEPVFRMVRERGDRSVDAEYHDHGGYDGPAWQMTCRWCAQDAELTAREEGWRIDGALRTLLYGGGTTGDRIAQAVDTLAGDWDNGTVVKGSGANYLKD